MQKRRLAASRRQGIFGELAPGKPPASSTLLQKFVPENVGQYLT
jgi:hypothetical protein